MTAGGGREVHAHREHEGVQKVHELGAKWRCSCLAPAGTGQRLSGNYIRSVLFCRMNIHNSVPNKVMRMHK